MTVVQFDEAMTKVDDDFMVKVEYKRKGENYLDHANEVKRDKGTLVIKGLDNEMYRVKLSCIKKIYQ